MNSIAFFRYCRELVQVRWKFSFGKHRDLRLHHTFFIADVDDTPPVRPITAVAIEVCGYNPSRLAVDDMWSPAEKLGLPEEFALLVELASISDLVTHPFVPAVREELILSLARNKPRLLSSVEDLRQSGAEPGLVDNGDDEDDAGTAIKV